VNNNGKDKKHQVTVLEVKLKSGTRFLRWQPLLMLYLSNDVELCMYIGCKEGGFQKSSLYVSCKSRSDIV